MQRPTETLEEFYQHKFQWLPAGIGQQIEHLTDETYNRATALFDEAYLSQVIMAIVTINAWNRIAITGKSELPK